MNGILAIAILVVIYGLIEFITPGKHNRRDRENLSAGDRWPHNRR